MTDPSVGGKGECEACFGSGDDDPEHTYGPFFVRHHALLDEKDRQLAELRAAFTKLVDDIDGSGSVGVNVEDDEYIEARRALESSRSPRESQASGALPGGLAPSDAKGDGSIPSPEADKTRGGDHS